MPEDGLNFTIQSVSQNGTMPTMAAGDFNGDGLDDIIFSDYHGTVAGIFKTEDSWEYVVIANKINNYDQATLIDPDGTKKSVIPMLPTPEDGYLIIAFTIRVRLGLCRPWLLVILMVMVWMILSFQTIMALLRVFSRQKNLGIMR